MLSTTRSIAGLLVLAALWSTLGCGGGSSSYTEKALGEYRAGHGADFIEKKKKPPTAQDVAAIKKVTKTLPAGSKEDFYQALRVLSNQRDHDEFLFLTGVTSNFDRGAYKRVFGEPDSLNTKESPQSWTHQTSNGTVRLRGYWKVDGSPWMMSTLPAKPK